MTCKACEKVQQENREGRNLAYLRVGNSNVLIGACDIHFNLLRQAIGVQPVYEKRPVVRVIKGEEG